MALMHVNFFSGILGMCVSMDVILPQKSKESAAKPCQTLYLLHGMSDDHTIWQRRTSVERYAEAYNLAVVMPSTELGWYTDTEAGLKWYTYIAVELPEICRQFFFLSDKAEDTFVAGLSMGGYGAFKLALSRPETFSHGASLSGALDIKEMWRRRMQHRNDGEYWKAIFNSDNIQEEKINNLFVLAEARKSDGKMPELFQWCGTEDFLYQDNVKFKNHLEKIGYENNNYTEGPGAHSWDMWDAQIQNVLKWLPLQKL